MHRKVDLQNADISEYIQVKFGDICSKCIQIFLSFSEDFGHTDLITIDIEIRDSMPILQRPYNLPLNVYSVGAERAKDTVRGRHYYS